MRGRIVLGNIGSLLRFFSYMLVMPLIVAFVYEQDGPGFAFQGVFIPQGVFLFLIVLLVSLLVAFMLETFAEPGDFREFEGFVIVGFSWLLITALGSLPFILSGTLSNPLDAFFESMSGFTTTGATVLPATASLGGQDWPAVFPPSVLFWRSFIQWLGGMGIIVLAVAVLPRLLETGAVLVRAELSGGAARLKPKITQTARIYWGVYLTLTLLGVGALFAIFFATEGLGMADAAYAAFVHAFSAISTGGFTPSATSVALFDSVLVEAVLILLMLVGAVNFSAHYYLLRGEVRRWTRDPEIRLFLLMFLVGFGLTAVLLFFRASEEAWNAMDPTGGHSLLQLARHALFQAASVQSTTGYASTNFDLWPVAVKVLFILMVLTGGCVGSTAGGVKQLRILILVSMVRREVHRIIYPRSVVPVRLKDVVVEDATIRTIVAFFFAFLAVYVASVVGLSLLGFDLLAAISSPAAAITSFGPAMGAGVGGPDFTFAGIHPLAKVILIGDMWLGRLEIFAVLLLFTPSTYRR